MSENQRRILELLKDRKITVDEAERLFALAAEPGAKDTQALSADVKKLIPKYLRVTVEPGEPRPDYAAERVNVRVPMNLIRAGMKLTYLIPGHAWDEIDENLKKQGVKFDLHNIKPEDIEELISALADMQVEVDGKHGEKVRVFMVY